MSKYEQFHDELFKDFQKENTLRDKYEQWLDMNEYDEDEVDCDDRDMVLKMLKEGVPVLEIDSKLQAFYIQQCDYFNY